MHRTATLIVLAGTVIAVPALGVAQAARVGVIPVPGNACLQGQPAAPAQLRARAAAAAAPRSDRHRAPSAHRRRGRDLRDAGEGARRLVARRDRDPQDQGRDQGSRISKGKIRLSSTLTVSFPGTKTVAPAKGGSFTVKGNSDALSGGLMGGSAGNDRFPVEPIGIGATWRVVDCDAIDEAPAKETRTYTLRSFTRDTAVMTYRDVVTMDPTRRDAGSQKVGSQVIKVKLDALHGTATGTVRIPLANGVATFARQVTRARFTFHLVAANAPATPVTTDLVDTRIDTPAG